MSNSNPSDIFGEGNKLMLSGCLSKAARLFADMLDGGLVHPSVRHNLGMCHELQKEWDVAHTLYARNIEEFPLYAPSHITLANVHIFKGNLQDAKSCLQNAVELDPSRVQAIIMLSELETVMGKAEEALALHLMAVGTALSVGSKPTPSHAQCYYDSQTGSAYHQFCKGSMLFHDGVDMDVSAVTAPLLRTAGKRNLCASGSALILLFTTAAYARLTANCLCTMHRAAPELLASTVIACVDAEAQAALRDALAHTAVTDDIKIAVLGALPDSFSRVCATHGSMQFSALMALKLMCVNALLGAGTTLIFCDADVTWYRDPTPELAARDEHFVALGSGSDSGFDTGFFRATPEALPLLDWRGVEPMAGTDAASANMLRDLVRDTVTSAVISAATLGIAHYAHREGVSSKVLDMKCMGDWLLGGDY